MFDVFLNQFHVEKPKNRVAQDQLLNWIIKCHQLAESKKASGPVIDTDLIEKLFQRYAVKSAQISQRFLETDDFASLNFDNNSIYKINDSQIQGSTITDRALFFSEKAYSIFKKFYNVETKNQRPNHIVHVTCTGYVSPSAPQRIVTEENWFAQTGITHAYHIGCYAALPAVRIAKGLIHAESPMNSDFTTDIVHNELCGLHMNPLAQTPEQMVIQTLFADGHIKYTATRNKQPRGKNLKILALHEKVVSNSQLDMSWMPAPWGMQMNLSREVPGKIQQELKAFSEELFKKAKFSYEDAMKSVFAIHPGGPKIIDAVQSVLELSENQVSESKKFFSITETCLRRHFLMYGMKFLKKIMPSEQKLSVMHSAQD